MCRQLSWCNRANDIPLFGRSRVDSPPMQVISDGNSFGRRVNRHRLQGNSCGRRRKAAQSLSDRVIHSMLISCAPSARLQA